MTFRKIKYLLGLTKKIVAVKDRNGDYIIYDTYHKTATSHHIAGYVNKNLNLHEVNKRINIFYEESNLRYSDKIGKVKFEDFYVAKIFSISLNIVYDKLSKKETEPYYIVQAYLNNKILAKKDNGYLFDGKSVKSKYRIISLKIS